MSISFVIKTKRKNEVLNTQNIFKKMAFDDTKGLLPKQSTQKDILHIIV